jgi:hypothetical protein
MKRKKLKLVMLSLILSVGVSKAQEATVSTGRDASGAGGSFSYSIGQVSYTEINGTSGSLLQGVQQPFEVLVLGTNDQVEMEVQLNVYPNPTNSFLILSSDKNEFLELELINIKGKSIYNSKFQVNRKIDMEAYPTGMYFLRVKENNQIIKSFKIIKN